MRIHSVQLPHSSLLILSGTPLKEDAGTLLARIKQASAGQRPGIWIDGSDLLELPEAIVRLLLRCGRLLHRQGQQLVLCHLAPDVRRRFPPDTAGLVIVPTLLDAENLTLMPRH